MAAMRRRLATVGHTGRRGRRSARSRASARGGRRQTAAPTMTAAGRRGRRAIPARATCAARQSPSAPGGRVPRSWPTSCRRRKCTSTRPASASYISIELMLAASPDYKVAPAGLSAREERCTSSRSKPPSRCSTRPSGSLRSITLARTPGSSPACRRRRLARRHRHAQATRRATTSVCYRPDDGAALLDGPARARQIALQSFRDVVPAAGRFRPDARLPPRPRRRSPDGDRGALGRRPGRSPASRASSGRPSGSPFGHTLVLALGAIIAGRLRPRAAGGRFVRRRARGRR